MIELLAGGILFLCCTYTGIGIRAYYRNRKELYSQYAGFLEHLKEDIGFRKTPLAQSTAEYCQGKKGAFIDMLASYRKMLEEGRVSRTDFDKLACSPYLDKQGRREFAEVFYGLGKVDEYTQTENLQKARAAVEGKLQYYKKKYDTTGTLAFKLGVVLGIAAMILAA